MAPVAPATKTRITTTSLGEFAFIPKDRAAARAVTALFVGDLEEHVGVAGPVERAVACQVAAAQLPPGVLDRDPQPAGQHILPAPPHRLRPAAVQRMRVARPR